MTDYPIVSPHLSDGPGPEWTIPARLDTHDGGSIGREAYLTPPSPGGRWASIYLDVAILSAADGTGHTLSIELDFDHLATWCDQVRAARQATEQ